MLQRLPEERHDVLIVERVEHDAAVAARADQPHAAQQAQLVRHRRLAQPQHRGQIADAELAVRQRIEDPHAGRIAERAEGVGQALHGVGRDQRRADLPDSGEVDLDQVADFGIIEHMSRCSYVSAGDAAACQVGAWGLGLGAWGLGLGGLGLGKMFDTASKRRPKNCDLSKNDAD